jgi:predicted transcriptional regulator
MTRIEYDGTINLKEINDIDIKDIVLKFVRYHLKKVAMDRETMITNIYDRYQRSVGNSNLYRILRELEGTGQVQTKKVGNKLYYFCGDIL